MHAGINTFRIGIEHLCLLPGGYFLAIVLGSGRGFEDYVPEAVQFEIVGSPEAAKIDADVLSGVFVLSARVSILD